MEGESRGYLWTMSKKTAAPTKGGGGKRSRKKEASKRDKNQSNVGANANYNSPWSHANNLVANRAIGQLAEAADRSQWKIDLGTTRRAPPASGTRTLPSASRQTSVGTRPTAARSRDSATRSRQASSSGGRAASFGYFRNRIIDANNRF